MAGLTNCTTNIYIFLVIKTFPSLSDALGLAETYWLYSSVSILTIAFAVFVLPETKDKRMEEIADDFAKKGNEGETDKLST